MLPKRGKTPNKYIVNREEGVLFNNRRLFYIYEMKNQWTWLISKLFG